MWHTPCNDDEIQVKQGTEQVLQHEMSIQHSPTAVGMLVCLPRHHAQPEQQVVPVLVLQ